MSGKVFCFIDGRYENLVAAKSKKAAAQIMKTTLYQLEMYGVDYEPDSDEGRMALAEPGVIFIRLGFRGIWRRVRSKTK